MRQSIAFLLVIVIAFTAQAAKKDKTKGLPAASGVPDVNDQPLKEAKSKLAVAQGKVERAQDVHASVLAKLRSEADASPAIKQAAENLKASQYEYDAASGPVLEKARASREYQAALDSKKAASQKVLDLQAQSGTPQDEISQAAKTVLEKGKVTSQLEAAAIAKDSKVAALKAKLDAANVNLLKARHDAEAGIKTNSELASAKKEIEDAQAALPPLQGAVSSAQEKYNADMAAHDKAMQDEKAGKSTASAAAGAGAGTKSGVALSKPRFKKKKA